jgi:hypothetical protein
MDEEEKLKYSLIGQEEAPAVNAGDVMIGQELPNTVVQSQPLTEAEGADLFGGQMLNNLNRGNNNSLAQAYNLPEVGLDRIIQAEPLPQSGLDRIVQSQPLTQGEQAGLVEGQRLGELRQDGANSLMQALDLPEVGLDRIVQSQPLTDQDSMNLATPVQSQPLTEAERADLNNKSKTSSSPDFSGVGVSLSPFTKGIFDSLKKGITQPQFGMMGIDPRQNPYKDTIAPDVAQSPTATAQSAQAAQAAQDLETAPNFDPFTGQTIENPTPFDFNNDPSAGMTMNQQAIANALAGTNAQSQEEGQVTATPPPQTLSQFMRYEDAPEQRTEQFVDEQGRLRFRPTQEALQLQAGTNLTPPPRDGFNSEIDPGFIRQAPNNIDPGFIRQAPNEIDPGFTRERPNIINSQGFQGAGEARESRLDARPDFNAAISDRDRRAARGEGLSQADLRDLAQGMDPNASEGQRMRALEIQQRAGLGQFKPEKELTDLEKREIESRIRGREADIAASEIKGGFEPRVIDVGEERAMELSPGYFQRIAKDKPNKTGLQTTLENLQADLKSGRLSQEQHDIAVGNATNIYIGLKEPKQTEIDVQKRIDEIKEGKMGATPAEGADASDVRSYATEAEAKAAGVKGEVLIGGRRAIIE